MVENSTLGAAHSYNTIYNTVYIAVCACRTKFHTEASYSYCVRCQGFGYIRGTD